MSTKKNIADGVQKRSIRDIPMPNNHGTFTKKKKTRTTKTSTSKPPRDFSRFALWSIVVISVVILGFAISSFFGGATVRITPKTQTVALNNTVTFAAGTSTPEYLVMEISDSTNREVVAEGDEYVETKAVGKIVIYNTHSTSPQTLIEQTRFESPEGYIYRIQEEVSVPGQKVVDGKTVPGQLEVTVIADKAGEKYNISPTDFTIPGFKGDSRFETFFARSQTEMTGGFMGTQKVISTEQQAQVENELQKPCKRLNKIKNFRLHLYGIPSPYWGQEQIVTGLLTGQDLLQGLEAKELGDELLLPSVMLRQGEKIFLDDMTLQELSLSLNVYIRIVHDAQDIVNKALGKA